jgi:hypothetical protein
MLNQVRTLESRDRTTKSKEASLSSLKAIDNLSSVDASSSIDNLTARINAKGAVADEEFNRTLGSLSPDEANDPLKDAAVDDVLNSLREPVTA